MSIIKKHLTAAVIIVLLMLPGISNGQAALLVLIFGDEAATENFHFSLDGGLNISNVSHLNGETATGLNFGLGVFMKINDKWSFVPEFKALSYRGEKGIERFFPLDSDFASNIESLESRIKLGYIDIPLMFRYELSPTFYLAAGPQISFRTSAELKTDAVLTGGTTTVEVTNDLRDLTQWYDLSVPIEIGMHVVKATTGKGLDLKFRWAPGLVDIAKDELDDNNLLNNNFQIIVSLPFLKSAEE